MQTALNSEATSTFAQEQSLHGVLILVADQARPTAVVIGPSTMSSFTIDGSRHEIDAACQGLSLAFGVASLPGEDTITAEGFAEDGAQLFVRSAEVRADSSGVITGLGSPAGLGDG
jgi:hypothetical protein